MITTSNPQPERILDTTQDPDTVSHYCGAKLMTWTNLLRNWINHGEPGRLVAIIALEFACLVVAIPLHAAPKLDAINVAVYCFEYPQNAGAAFNVLEANGYNTDRVMLTDIATGLPGYDILYITHPFDAGGWSPLACNGLKNFLARGKGVVLEWDASLLAFNALGPSIYVNAQPQCGLFVGMADN